MFPIFIFLILFQKFTFRIACLVFAVKQTVTKTSKKRSRIIISPYLERKKNDQNGTYGWFVAFHFGQHWKFYQDWNHVGSRQITPGLVFPVPRFLKAGFKSSENLVMAFCLWLKNSAPKLIFDFKFVIYVIR